MYIYTYIYTYIEKPKAGADPCTYGPSYWCESQENANECNYDFTLCNKGTYDV